MRLHEIEIQKGVGKMTINNRTCGLDIIFIMSDVVLPALLVAADFLVLRTFINKYAVIMTSDVHYQRSFCVLTGYSKKV